MIGPFWWWSFISIFLFLSCTTNPPVFEEPFLKKPVGLEVLPLSGRKFLVRYYVQNQEVSFDGYNLYISRESISDGEPIERGGNLPPLNLDGSLPTFKHTKEDFSPSIRREREITYYKEFIPFQEGVTYYFRMAAHSIYGEISLLSNEVSATALP